MAVSTHLSRSPIPPKYLLKDQGERLSREFEDCVAGVMRGLGFRVIQRFELPVAQGLTREIDLLCSSYELGEGCEECEVNDGGFAERLVIQPYRRVVWVEVKRKRNGGRVGIHVLSDLFGTFSYMLMSQQNEHLPSQIWVVTSGRFSRSAKRFAEATRGILEPGREFIVLVDGRKLKKLGGKNGR